MLKKYEEEDGRYLICGTNAYKPECRDYVEVIFPQSKIFLHHSLSRDLVQDGDTYLMTKKSKGVGLCPYRFSIDENLLIRIKSSKATTASKETKHDVDTDTLFSPDHNSTAVLVGDKLYAGTAADYQVRVQQRF